MQESACWQNTKAEVLKMAEGMACEQDTDCVAIPMGSRACGGPQFHVIIVPSQLKDSTKFKETVARYTADMKKHNINQNVTGICSVVMPPSLICKENRCHMQAESWDSDGVKVSIGCLPYRR